MEKTTVFVKIAPTPLLPSLSAKAEIMAASRPSLLVFSLFVAGRAVNDKLAGGGLEPIPMTALKR
jgi:hypothetical protein